METNQVKLLISLAKKIRIQNKDKTQAVASLHSAGILTKRGNFTSHYGNLKKVAKATK